jgi:hypothetical protein
VPLLEWRGSNPWQAALTLFPSTSSKQWQQTSCTAPCHTAATFHVLACISTPGGDRGLYSGQAANMQPGMCSVLGEQCLHRNQKTTCAGFGGTPRHESNTCTRAEYGISNVASLHSLMLTNAWCSDGAASQPEQGYAGATLMSVNYAKCVGLSLSHAQSGPCCAFCTVHASYDIEHDACAVVSFGIASCKLVILSCCECRATHTRCVRSSCCPHLG